MKTLAKIGIVVALAGTVLTSCTGSYYVTARPNEPYYERPATPYAGAVWIDGDWVWRGGRYTYRQGHWERPRAGRVWVRGNWESGRRGYVWHKGHWR